LGEADETSSHGGGPRLAGSRPDVLGSWITELADAASARPHAAPTRTDVADGIYLFSTPAYFDVGLDGNSVVIVSDEGVLVFDSNGTPAAAAAVLAEIRKLTDQPNRVSTIICRGTSRRSGPRWPG